MSHALKNILRVVGGCGVVALMSMGPANVGGRAPQIPAPQGVDLDALVNGALGLTDSTVLEPLWLDQTAPAQLQFLLPIEGVPQVIDLARHSVRAAGYQLLVQEADGAIVPHALGPEVTWRGSVAGFDGSVVAASTLDDGMHALILLPGGDAFWLEPIGERVPGADPDLYVLYRGDDVIESGGTCGLDALADPFAAFPEHEGAGGGIAGGTLCTAELAADADFEFFQDYGSVAAVENRINSVINAVNVQYESEVGITHVVTAIVVRSAEPDPYTSSDASTLLNQFRSEWLANQGGIQRDLAQLFTGKNLNGSTIGIAWLSAVCTSFGYSVVESDCCGSFACTTDLTAHELGHNWGADHCSCGGNTMNSGLTCTNTFNPTFTIPDILAYLNSISCVDCGPAPQCGDPGTGDCFVANGSPACEDADCCNTVCATDPFCCDTQWDQQCADEAAAMCNTGGGDVAPLTNLTIAKGTLVGGGLPELQSSDDTYIVIDAESPTATSIASAVVVATTAHLDPTRMDVTVEVGADISGAKTQIFLRNYNVNKWIRQERFTQPTSDTVKIYLDIFRPWNYVDANGTVKVRVLSKKNNAPDLTMRIDHVEVVVTP